MTQEKATPPQGTAEPQSLVDEKFTALLYVCEDTRHWIIQADTKASFLLTINGVVAGFMVPQGLLLFALWKKQTSPGWALWLVLVILLGYLVFQLYALWHTTLVFVPRKSFTTPEQSHSSRHVFNLSLFQHFPRLEDGDRLRDEFRALSAPELQQEYLVRLQSDSLICSAKYRSFRQGFQATLMALGLAAAVYLGILLLTAM